MRGIETLPQAWDDERDSAFFRITSHLFDPRFTAGAHVLLASYDDDRVLVAAGAPAA